MSQIRNVKFINKGIVLIRPLPEPRLTAARLTFLDGAMRMRSNLTFTGTGEQIHIDSIHKAKPASILLALQFWHRHYNIFVSPGQKNRVLGDILKSFTLILDILLLISRILPLKRTGKWYNKSVYGGLIHENGGKIAFLQDGTHYLG
jgi:hypothetical protein